MPTNVTCVNATRNLCQLFVTGSIPHARAKMKDSRREAGVNVLFTPARKAAWWAAEQRVAAAIRNTRPTLAICHKPRAAARSTQLLVRDLPSSNDPDLSRNGLRKSVGNLLKEGPRFARQSPVR